MKTEISQQKAESSHQSPACPVGRLVKWFVLLFTFFFFNCSAQEQSQDVILKAMKDELKRNIENLKLDKLKPPFFISYTICDAKTLYINSTLGSIVKSETQPFRKQENEVIIGDYNRTNENYVDENSIWYWERNDMSIPFGNDYNAIKRALWYVTDDKYKDATAKYEAKLSSMEQQNLTDEEKNLPDFSKAPKLNLLLPSVTFNLDKAKWENTAKELSSIFKTYNEIFKSDVSVFLYEADVYFTNSELTEVKYPLAIAAIRIYAQTQAPDGEPLNDHVLYYALTPDDLPAMEIMKKEIKEMADNITALRKVPTLKETYSGPVLIEGEAVAEIICQKFFSGTTGLTGNRKPILSNPQIAQMAGNLVQENALENLFNKKIISRDLTIKATPLLKEFNGKKLIGSFEVDAEGVKPGKELTLIENGVLKNLLNDRIPSTKVSQSNGHRRCALMNGSITTLTGPGVINVSTNKGVTKEELKQKLIAAAKEEDLEYAYIVRKIENPNAGIKKDDNMYFFGGGQEEKKDVLTKPIKIYRISVKDGKEELVRSAEVGGLTIRSFKRILGAAKSQFVYNSLINGKKQEYNSWLWPLYGIPATFIVPDAILFEEIDIQKEKRAVTKKLPVVSNPVGK